MKPRPTLAWHGTMRAGARVLIDRRDWRGRHGEGLLFLVAEDELPGGARDRYVGSDATGDRCARFTVKPASGERITIAANVALQVDATTGMLFMLNTGPETIWPMVTLNEVIQ